VDAGCKPFYWTGIGAGLEMLEEHCIGYIGHWGEIHFAGGVFNTLGCIECQR
jgi:hypothetical protein